jgi:hypothetical protein
LQGDQLGVNRHGSVKGLSGIGVSQCQ